MISRLLLTTAIGLVLVSAAVAQGGSAPSNTDSNTPAVAQTQGPANSAAVSPAVTLSEGVSVTEQDRSRIGESIARMNVRSLRGVDFSVSVGAKVPRELRTYSLPADALQIVPPYRDYRFLVVEKQVVIVEPKTNKIVTILKPNGAPTATATNAGPDTPAHTAPSSVPAPAEVAATRPAPVATTPVATTPVATTPVATAPPAEAATASAPATAKPNVSETTASISPGAAGTSTADQTTAPTRESSVEPERPKAKKQASRSQRRAVSRAERDEWRRSSAEVRVGQRLPDDVVLHRLPPRYYNEIPATREYRYRGYAGGWRGRIYEGFD